jgi:hypothetical protein
VLGQKKTRDTAAKAYPQLGLKSVSVSFGFTGIGGPEGVGVDELNELVPPSATSEQAKAFWWATILRAAAQSNGAANKGIAEFIDTALKWKERENLLTFHEKKLFDGKKPLLVVYDALDMVATTWPRRRLLTEALLEVVWSMRAYRAIKLKLFLRPDQIDDDALRFVELPKLRTGAVRLEWSGTDLYGLLYARLALSPDAKVRGAFTNLLKLQEIAEPTQVAILARRWPLAHDRKDQTRVMEAMAGPYMSAGPHGYKKGRTYDWPITHVADAFHEVTPRSFLGLMIGAATYGATPADKAITPDGIRHGLREASKTRVDQLHLEFPWIKGVLAPLDGLLLPQNETQVFRVWQRAKTINSLLADAKTNNYLPPFPIEGKQREQKLFEALARIGVMFRRKDGRVDMPDLFRVAAKLLKKGGTAPL